MPTELVNNRIIYTQKNRVKRICSFTGILPICHFQVKVISNLKESPNEEEQSDICSGDLVARAQYKLVHMHKSIQAEIKVNGLTCLRTFQ